MKIYTIGHSTRPIGEFIHLLRVNHVVNVVDVRTYPSSRKFRQYNKDELNQSLASERILYLHRPSMGGLREARPDSCNLAWKNTGFRGFADHMQTSEFQRALDDLIEIGKTNVTAIMCAEAVPWRCHRQLIADALIARSVDVFDIISEALPEQRKLAPFAAVQDGKVQYPLVKNLLGKINRW